MKMYVQSLLNLSFLVGLCCAQIYSVENADGSFSFGKDDSDAMGETANSVVALLKKSGGWTEQTHNVDRQDVIEVESNGQSGSSLRAHVEVLRLLETILHIKGEVGARVYALINDNYDMLRSVYGVFVRNIGTLHAFTINGIVVLRKLLEFAAALLEQWQVSVDVSAADTTKGPGFSSSFHIG